MGLLHGPKADIGCLIKDNLSCYCAKTSEMAEKETKVVPSVIKSRASSLICQRSATELRHPPTSIPLSFRFTTLLQVIVKPEALHLTSSGTTCLSFPLLFQGS